MDRSNSNNSKPDSKKKSRRHRQSKITIKRGPNCTASGAVGVHEMGDVANWASEIVHRMIMTAVC